MPERSGSSPNKGSTFTFRAINPELFIRPNKVVMGFGAAAMAGCILYIAYMHANDDKKRIQVSVETGRKDSKSKWD